MSRLSRYIGSQFSDPHGFVGLVCCFIMNRINKKQYNTVASEIDKKKAVLDIGYGNGYLISKIYKKTKSQITGIDISEDMKAAAQKRNKAGVTNGDIKLLIGDCCDLPFDDGVFDAVTSVNTIYFWSDTLCGLREIRRVLKDNGSFCNAVYTKKWLTEISYTKEIFKLFEKEDYIELGKKAGFKNVDIVNISSKSFMVIFVK